MIRKILLYLIYFAIVIALITIIILGFKVSPAGTKVTTRNPKTPFLVQAPTIAAPKMSTPTTPSVSSHSTPSTNSSPNRALSNSGPGNVFELFILVAIISGLLHWRYTNFKLQQNN